MHVKLPVEVNNVDIVGDGDGVGGIVGQVPFTTIVRNKLNETLLLQT